MSSLLRATGAGSRPAPQVHRPPSQVSNDVLRVPSAGTGASASRRVSQQSVAVSINGNHGTAVHRTISNTSVPQAPPPPAKEKLKSWLKGAYKRYHLKNLIPLLLIMFYMLLGAIIFYWLEGSNDSEDKLANYKQYLKEKEFLYRRFEEIVHDRAMTRSRVARKKSFLEAVRHFEDKIGFSITKESSWDLMTAMYYSGTLFTTIGYGDVSCVTTAGRILTVIYSCVGIPLMLITLNDLGKFLYNNINGCVKSIDDVYLGVLRVCNIRKPLLPDEVDMVERGEQTMVDVSSLASEIGSEHSEGELDEEIHEANRMPQMSVKVALFITIGWILFCSALFRLWEDWTYGESLYFMYISLSTIGLGDISVARKDMMVLCFAFVIVGLSLVSMCINVVQVALEDFYVNMMMKLIMDYQEKMAAGGDHMGASVGMMRMWGGNKTAKLLMPLLSKEKKKMAMEKVEIEAKNQGIEIPSILTDLDEKSGLPKLFHLEEKNDDVMKEEMEKKLEEMVQKQINKEEEIIAPIYIAFEAETQTEIVTCLEKNEQTIEVDVTEESSQTEMEKKECMEGVETQTDGVTSDTCETQTSRVETMDNDMMTVSQPTSNNETQTNIESTSEQESQTYMSEQVDAQTATEIETKNIRIQTPCPVIEQRTIQTEDLEERKSPSKMSSARKRLRRAFAKPKQRSQEPLPAMSDWKEVEEEDSIADEEELEDEGSVESLHWDPVDGMHAEKQLPVSRLTAMFDRNQTPEHNKKSDSGRKFSSFKRDRGDARSRKTSE